MNAEIITIGDEILIGQIVDTNSAFICKELNKIGISVYQISSIQDDKTHILKALKEAEENVDVIIITGGLGPTKDDITKNTLCQYFDDHLVKNESVLKHIEALFAKYLITPVSDLNRQQAMVPSKATVLQNDFGTAPGMWIEKNNKVFISLPGVPYEMKALMKTKVLKGLQSKYNCPFIMHKTLLTYGLGESAIANRLNEWEDLLPSFVKLAYLPNLGKVRLRLSGKGFDKTEIENEIERLTQELMVYVKDIYVGFEEESSLEAIVGNLLIIEHLTLSTAESCTGGAIAKMLTSVPGASQFYIGSVISYNERIKREVLQVDKATIKEFSVVSAEVASQMALGVKKLYKTDYAISVTGNAGPTSDNTKAPVGKVFICIAGPEGHITEEFNFGKPREKVIEKASVKALELLRKNLLKNS